MGPATLPPTMTLRRLLPVSFALIAVALPASAQAADQVIAPGVKAGGIDLGGQTVESASANLQLALGPTFARPVDVQVGAKTFRLQPTDAQFAFDPLTTAKRAYYAGRDGDPAHPNQDVPLALTFSVKSLRTWAADVDKQVSRAPRNASATITLRRIVVKKARNGKTINEASLARRLAATLLDPARPRVLRAKMNDDRPDVGMAQLRRRYGTVLTVDRNNLKLRVFKRLKLSKTYGIAIGAAGHDTPSGLFNIQSKQVNPAWHVPRSEWAGSLQGQTIPGGAPNNPLKARWLGVNGSVGIHGTAEEWSIGSRASHGCIRMRVRDVVDLFPRVPMGSPVLIK
jgi:lipoprotein-anchoring transpeptidase ErfK/SrfK